MPAMSTAAPPIARPDVAASLSVAQAATKLLEAMWRVKTGAASIDDAIEAWKPLCHAVVEAHRGTPDYVAVAKGFLPAA